jgi:hypothetical protein
MTSAASNKFLARPGRKVRPMLNLHRRLGRTKVLHLGVTGRRDRFILKLDGVSVGGIQIAGNLICDVSAMAH